MLAEIAAVAVEAPDVFIFPPVPLFVVATYALRAHSVSGDAAALCLATAVLSIKVAVFQGQVENPPILVATVFSFVFLVFSASLVVAANVVSVLAAAAPRALRR